MRASRRTIDLEPFAVAKATLARLTTYPLVIKVSHSTRPGPPPVMYLNAKWHTPTLDSLS